MESQVSAIIHFFQKIKRNPFKSWYVNSVCNENENIKNRYFMQVPLEKRDY
ncbi:MULTISPECIES: hypothetical protein [Bacillus]|uniref:hypothetical protein n=1 Tax=Bacillus TaxID=1386 RepID=UPI0012BAA749|nr:hypothetical protein [Bacillus cereus]